MNIPVQETFPAAGRSLLGLAFIVDAAIRLDPAATLAAGDAYLRLGAAASAAAAGAGLIGGWLLIVGWRTRAAALALAALQIVGVWLSLAAGLAPEMSVPVLKDLALAGGLLQVFAFGAGDHSLDEDLSRKRGRRPRLQPAYALEPAMQQHAGAGESAH